MKKVNSKQNLYQNYQRNLIRATVTTNIGINNNERLINAYGVGLDRIDVLNKFKRQSKFTIYWFVIFFVLGIACLIADPSDWLNVLDLFVVMINIYLLSKGKLMGMVIGIIECGLYAYISYKTQLFGEVVKVLAISVPLNFVSLINWLINMRKLKKEKFKETSKKEQEDITVKKLTKKMFIIYLFVTVGVAVASYFFLKYVLNQKTALIFGAIALTMTIVGKILTAQRFMDSWIVYIFSDIICICMWLQTLITTPFDFASITMLVYYAACLSNDTFAYFSWKGMYRRVVVNGGVLLAMRDVKIKKIARLKRQYKVLYWNKEIDMKKNS